MSREIVESQDHFGWKTLEFTELNRNVNLAPDHVPVTSAALHMASCPNPSPTWCRPLDTFIPFLYCAIHPVLINGAGAARWLGPGRHDTPAKHGTPARSSPRRHRVRPATGRGAAPGALGGAGSSAGGRGRGGGGRSRDPAPRPRPSLPRMLRGRAAPARRRAPASCAPAPSRPAAARAPSRCPRATQLPRAASAGTGEGRARPSGRARGERVGPRGSPPGRDKGAGGFVAGVCVRGEGGSGPR